MQNQLNKDKPFEIRLFGDDVLRKQSKHVKNINNNVISIINRMVKTLEKSEGIGLAAPQIGKQLRLFIVNTLWEDKPEIKIFINPEILEMEGKQFKEEGCLSIPDIFEKVPRALYVTFKATDINGNSNKYNFSDTMSRVVQHETDHLDGVLFIDKLLKLKKMLIGKKLNYIKKLSEERRKFDKKH